MDTPASHAPARPPTSAADQAHYEAGQQDAAGDGQHGPPREARGYGAHDALALPVLPAQVKCWNAQ